MNTKFSAIIFSLATFFTATAKADETNAFKTDKEKTSYAIGFDSGSRMRQSEIEVDLDMYMRGLKDGHSGGARLLSDQELRELFSKLRQEITAKQHEKQRQLGEKNRKEGEEFLAANKTKAGVVTLPSGLQYTVVNEGQGESPKPEDTVTVNYRGTLIDGMEFDKSPEGQPATFPVNGVIRGWTEALTKMKTGAKWKLFVPADLAYGLRGSPPKIGPNATLIFDVELISFKPAPAQSANPNPNPPLTSDIIKVPSLEEMKKGAKIETIKAEDVERLQKEQQSKEKQAQPDKK